MSVDLSQIQGNILRGAGFGHARYVFYHFKIRNEIGAFLEEVAKMIVPHTRIRVEGRKKRDSTINIAFTYAGLKVCGVTYDPTGRYLGGGRQNEETSDAFVTGMKAARELLADEWEEHLEDWWSRNWKEGDLHLLVWISAKNAKVLEQQYRKVRTSAKKHGVRQLGYQNAAALPKGVEHFGFVDGVSQPVIEGVEPPMSGLGKISARGWEPLAIGEFLLGHRDEGHPQKDKPAAEEPNWLPLPEPESVTKDATFLVYRKLAQDVFGFREFVRRAESVHQEEGLAEALMGRRRDGEPLMSLRPGSTGMADDNDFLYKDDPNGYVCSLSSHVRRANPRDDFHFEGRLVNRHRIIRRGMTYGPWLSDHATEPDNCDRGLIFIAFNARIEDQFEFIQSRWLNGGRPFRIGGEPDVIAGNPAKKESDHKTGEGPVVATHPVRVVVNGEPPIIEQLERTFVKFLGGEYFLVPALPGLAAIIARANEGGN